MEYTHLGHDLLLFFLLLFTTLVLFRKRLRKLSFLQVSILIFLSVFVSIHENPAKLLFAAHHGETVQSHKHACCIPQVNDAVSYKEITHGAYFVHFIVIPKEVHVLPLTFSSLKNKSPPFA